MHKKIINNVIFYYFRIKNFSRNPNLRKLNNNKKIPYDGGTMF